MISNETIELIKKFRDDRDWKQFHNPKDLAISINLEASELLEIFQLSAEDLECTDKLDKVKEELADVLNYCVLLADRYGLDMDEIIQAKIKKNEEKHPAKVAYGNKAKYTELKKEGEE
jgi:NTP pyrophosphatase (non-canonical NTP hydrolase)